MLNISCSNVKKSTHYAFIDYLRGIALLMMFIYHFCFDLNYFQFIQTDFYHNPGWIYFRIVIVSLFLWLVGISLHLATTKTINKKRFAQRLAILIFASAIVSLSSYFTFPNSYIFFGILHFIALASLVGLFFIRYHTFNLILGIVLIIIATIYSNPLFNHPALQWFGLMPSKPITEDYAPFLPWFGVVLIGLYSGSLLFKKRSLATLSTFIGNWNKQQSRQRQILCCMGQHSLLIYLTHQPIFIGILYVFNLMLA